ncbi:MAG: heme exporter protein CcmD [Enhydrobacter sp.]|nr:MAG: heme exporter protein CcmD [Enhydrobacter sp.]
MSHAVFIWSSYAVAALGLGGLLALSLLARRKVRRALEARGVERTP